MGIYDLLAAKSVNISDLALLDLTSLYLLIAPSTPTEVRDEVIERASAGEMLSRQQVRHIVQQARSVAPSTRQVQPGISVKEALDRTGYSVLRKLSNLELERHRELAREEGPEIALEWAECRAKLKRNFRDLLLGLELQERAAKSSIRKIIDAIPAEQRSTTAERLRVAAEFLLKLRARLAET